jgi:glycosyltransferase involved in cell wall biosynthesis
VDPPAVSICVPTYNGAPHLRSCLDSALGQTFKDFELVIVDDHSTDATRDVVQEYARSDARVTVSVNPHTLGLAANWNRCVELARGEWVKFLFQDDLLEPSCLERMLAAARDDVDLVVARRGLIFEPGTPPAIEERYRRYVEEHNLARHCRGESYLPPQRFVEILAQNPTSNCIGEPTATLIRRRAFARYGRFNGDLVILSDWEYTARVAANTGLCYVDATLAHFRVHEAGATSKIRSEREYRVLVIDPLLVMHEIAYGRHWARARALGRGLPRPVDFRTRLAETVRARRRQDRAVRREWWTTLLRYPRLLWSPLGRRLWPSRRRRPAAL